MLEPTSRCWLLAFRCPCMCRLHMMQSSPATTLSLHAQVPLPGNYAVTKTIETNCLVDLLGFATP